MHGLKYFVKERRQYFITHREKMKNENRLLKRAINDSLKVVTSEKGEASGAVPNN
jgi:hypothetical protein